MNAIIEQVTQDITSRSHKRRVDYLSQIQDMKTQGVARKSLSCGNLAHAFAAGFICPSHGYGKWAV